MLQTPFWFHMNKAANVEHGARVEAEGWRVSHFFGDRWVEMPPGVPAHTVALYPATAELARNLSERHTEVTREELHSVTQDMKGKSIPIFIPNSGSCVCHGFVCRMYSHDDDIIPQMANVLFEGNSAHQ